MGGRFHLKGTKRKGSIVMTKIFLAAVAASMAIAAPAIALDYSDIRDGYSADAFSGADERWRRITSNRYGECSRFGDKSSTRLDVLVDRYLAIGEALEANDETAAMAATEKLAKAIKVNGRFEECWNKVSRREKVPADFRAMLDSM